MAISTMPLSLAVAVYIVKKLLFPSSQDQDVHDEEDSITDNEDFISPLHVIIEEPRQDTQWITPIFFDDDDPRDWEDYHGQEKIKEFIQLQIDVVEPLKGLKLMLIAEKGAGKTTLFRITANKLISKRLGRYIEVTPAMLQTKADVDDLMDTLRPHDILCIDEIHMLNRKLADTLLPAIEDGIFPFDSGMRSLPKGITWIGATTDVGLLPEAFQDRFQMLGLERLSKENLVKILLDMPFPIDHCSAEELATRSVGSPRELKRVYSVCRDVAKREGKKSIDLASCRFAFELLDLDEHGLYPHDRKVLEALWNNPKYYAKKADGTQPKRFAHSERAIRALSGLDESLYRDQIEPKLLRQGFLTIGTAGRELTDSAIATYFAEK